MPMAVLIVFCFSLSVLVYFLANTRREILFENAVCSSGIYSQILLTRQIFSGSWPEGADVGFFNL